MGRPGLLEGTMQSGHGPLSSPGYRRARVPGARAVSQNGRPPRRWGHHWGVCLPLNPYCPTSLKTKVVSGIGLPPAGLPASLRVTVTVPSAHVHCGR